MQRLRFQYPPSFAKDTFHSSVGVGVMAEKIKRYATIT